MGRKKDYRNKKHRTNDVVMETQKKLDMYKKDDEIESLLTDKTAYGEWMSTTNGWVSFEEQNNHVDHMEEITKTE
ncbi:hypothetical protein [Thermohalobacter berrensis]|uniref:Uncharacterized protein n=1 Tax=Thermohalobacter berrensis TaxID=99594 RepID=A0A419T8Q9_9FIRM|nr:hypothetical protein [Thermohalobacter berrensis]RKD33756.1 hypothetical protein BET03_08505 [Thermohalobacter berrensis]